MAVISDSADRPPATAMLFEHEADDDVWAVWELHAHRTWKGHVGAQCYSQAIIEHVLFY
ncbi:MAG: hypothetical protein AB7O62_20910 [Pirellulales bacterium]